MIYQDMQKQKEQDLDEIESETRRIQELVEEHKERGEIIVNITDAFVNGEISEEDYHDLIARACEDNNELD